MGNTRNRSRKSGGRSGPASAKVNLQIADLENKDTAQLRTEWQNVYGNPPPPRISRDLLMLGIGYQIQADVHGGLRPAVQRRLKRLAQESVSATVSKPRRHLTLKPGSKLIREWHGNTYQVSVLDVGYAFDGKLYRSLSQIAYEITGARWSGPRFFGVDHKSRRISAKTEQETG